MKRSHFAYAPYYAHIETVFLARDYHVTTFEWP